MNSRLDALAERRKALIARSDQQRAELTMVFGGIERRFVAMEVVAAGARRLYRHRVLIGAVGTFVVLGPAATRSWFRKALWVAPLALKGYRRMKARADARREDDSPQ